jgi:hypothetical protein
MGERKQTEAQHLWIRHISDTRVTEWSLSPNHWPVHPTELTWAHVKCYVAVCVCVCVWKWAINTADNEKLTQEEADWGSHCDVQRSSHTMKIRMKNIFVQSFREMKSWKSLPSPKYNPRPKAPALNAVTMTRLRVKLTGNFTSFPFCANTND